MGGGTRPFLAKKLIRRVKPKWLLRNYKPTTPARRNMAATDLLGSCQRLLQREASLEPTEKDIPAVTTTGRITVRHRGGGNRTKYRVIDFKRNKLDVPATVTYFGI